jgi:hypothetical protein
MPLLWATEATRLTEISSRRAPFLAKKTSQKKPRYNGGWICMVSNSVLYSGATCAQRIWRT